MSISLKPKQETNEYISPIFNLNNFYQANDDASKSDLLSYTLLIIFKILTHLQVV